MIKLALLGQLEQQWCMYVKGTVKFRTAVLRSCMYSKTFRTYLQVHTRTQALNLDLELVSTCIIISTCCLDSSSMDAHVRT